MVVFREKRKQISNCVLKLITFPDQREGVCVCLCVCVCACVWRERERDREIGLLGHNSSLISNVWQDGY